MQGDWRKLTETDVGKALLVTPDTVHGWSKSGMPGPPFDLAVVLPWKIDREMAKLKPKVTGADSEEALERKRHWDAENARLKNEQLQGQLLDRDEVLETVTETAHLVRSHLSNLGSELSVALSRTNDAIEIREMIDQAVAEKLSGLQLEEEGDQ